MRLAGASRAGAAYNGTPESNDSRTATFWWSFSPNDVFYNGSILVETIDKWGALYYENVKNSRGVRPVISLAPGTRTSGGDGSRDDPYTIEIRDAS